jgi:hypothetical protein
MVNKEAMEPSVDGLSEGDNGLDEEFTEHVTVLGGTVLWHKARGQPGNPGAVLRYPLAFYLRITVDASTIASRLLRQPCNFMFIEGPEVAWYRRVEFPDWQVTTGDFYNFVRHLGDDAWQPNRLRRNLNLELPSGYVAGPGRPETKDDAPVMFTKPHPFITLEVKEGKRDMMAVEHMREITGYDVEPEFDMYTGATIAYVYGNQRWELADCPLAERDELFPGWRQSPPKFVDEARAAGHEVVRDPGIMVDGILRVNPHLLSTVMQRADMVFMVAPPGAGKTFAVKEVLTSNPQLTAVAFSCYRAVAQGLAKDLPDFENYLDKKPDWYRAPRVIVSLENILSVESSGKKDVLVGDEAPELLAHILSRTLKGKNKETLKALGRMFQSTKQVVLISADQDIATVEMAIRLWKSGDANRPCKVVVLQLDSPPPVRHVALFSDEVDLRRMVLHACANNQRMYIPCGFKSFARDLEEELAGKMRCMRVASDTDDQLMRDVHNPDVMRDVDGIISTSTLGTGVSITSFAADVAICFPYAGHGLFNQAQMFFRVRKIVSGKWFAHLTCDGAKPENHILRSFDEIKKAFMRGEDDAEALDRLGLVKPERDQWDKMLLDLQIHVLARRCLEEFGDQRTNFLRLLATHHGMTGMSEDEVGLFRVGRSLSHEALTYYADLHHRSLARLENDTRMLLHPLHKPFEELRDAQSRGSCTAEDKTALRAAGHGKFLHVREPEVHQSWDIAPALLCDVGGRGMKPTVRNLRGFLYEGGIKAPTLKMQNALLAYLLRKLGFDNLLSCVLFHPMELLPNAVSESLTDHWSWIAHVVGLDTEVNQETLFPRKGLKGFAWPGEAPLEYDCEHPILAKDCPKVVLVVLLQRLIKKSFPELKLARVNSKQIVIYKAESLVRGIDPTLTPLEFQREVVHQHQPAEGEPSKRVKVCQLKLGPPNKLARVLEIMLVTAENTRGELLTRQSGLVPYQQEVLARQEQIINDLVEPVEQRREEVASEVLSASYPEDMRGSIVYKRAWKQRDLARKRARKAEESIAKLVDEAG